jgi:hypothetical protein
MLSTYTAAVMAVCVVVFPAVTLTGFLQCLLP